MAISARFLADFSSFTDAVKKADVSLNQFEQSTHKVGTSLNKMVDSFSGAKILREAALAEEAVLRIGGASKLTAAEQARVNATVTEALDKYRALGVEAPRSLQMMADETKRVEQAMQPASKLTADFTNHFKGMLAGMLSATAIIGGIKMAFSALTEFVGSSIQSFLAAEAAQKKLTAALTAAGQATPAVIGQFNKLAKEFQNTTVYSDDLITEMQALLVEVGGVLPGEMGKALEAATNLASGLGVDLRTATMLVGKAFEGETGTLKRYGIVIDEATLKAKGMPAVLDAIQAKFGGQAQAEAASYAGQIKSLENAWDEYKETIGAAIVLNPIVEATLRTLNDRSREGEEAVRDHTHSWSDFIAKISESGNIPILGGPLKALELFIRRTEDASAAANKLAKDNPALFNPIPSAADAQAAQDARKAREEIEKTKEANKRKAESDKQAAEAAKQHAEAIKKLTFELSDAKLQGEVKKLTSAFAGLERQGEPTQAELERVGKAAKTLYDQGAKLSPSLFNVMVATENLLPPMKELSQEMLSSLGPALKSTYDLSAKLPPALNSINTSVGQMLAWKMPDLGPQAEKVFQDFKKLRGSIEDVSHALAQFSKVGASGGAELQPFIDRLKTIGVVSDELVGKFRTVTANLADMLSAASAAGKSAEAFGAGLTAIQHGKVTEGLASMATGAMGMVSAFDDATDSGTKAERAIGGMAAGAKIGTQILPGWGTAIGAAAGAIVGFVRGMNQGRDAVKDFAKAFGGFDDLHEKLLTLGSEGEALWRKLTQGTGNGNPQQAKATIDEITSAFEEQAQGVNELNSELASMLAAAQGTGARLPAEFQPFIDQLKEMGALSADNATALAALGVGNVAGFEQMEAAAKKFGIELSALGQTFQQQKLTATASEIIKAFDLLVSNGADFNGVLAGMKDEINAVVADSVKFGTEIPANMQPWIEKLIQSGELVDANGQKITDINNLKFGEAIAVGLEDVVAKLQEMIDLMTGGLPAAVQGLSGDLAKNKGAWNDWSKNAKAAADAAGAAVRGSMAGAGAPSETGGSATAKTPDLTKQIREDLERNKAEWDGWSKYVQARTQEVADKNPVPKSVEQIQAGLEGNKAEWDAWSRYVQARTQEAVAGDAVPESVDQIREHLERNKVEWASWSAYVQSQTQDAADTGSVSDAVERIQGDLDRNKGVWAGWSAFVRDRTGDVTTGTSVPDFLNQIQEDLDRNKGVWAGWSAYVRERTGEVGDSSRDLGGALTANLSGALERVKEVITPAEIQALSAGYAKAVSDGFAGSQDAFLAQQLQFYAVLQEGDTRLRTWFSGDTLSAFTQGAEAAGRAAGQALTGGVAGAVDGLQATIAQRAAWDDFEAMAGAAGIDAGDELFLGLASGLATVQDLLGDPAMFALLQANAGSAAKALETAFGLAAGSITEAVDHAGAALASGVGRSIADISATLTDPRAWEAFTRLAAEAGLTVGRDLSVGVTSGLTSLTDLLGNADIFAVLQESGASAATALEQAFGLAAGSVAAAMASLGDVPAAMTDIRRSVDVLHATLSDTEAWDHFQAIAAQSGVRVGRALEGALSDGLANLQDLFGNVDVFAVLERSGASAAAALEQAFGLAAGSLTSAREAITDFVNRAGTGGVEAGAAIQVPFEQAMDAIHGRLGAQAAWEQFQQMAGNAGLTVGEDLRAGVESGLTSLDELIANRDVFEILSRNGASAAAALEAAFGFAAGSITEAMAKAGQEGSVNFEGPMTGCFTRIEDLMRDPSAWNTYAELAHNTAEQAASWLTERIGASKATVDAILSDVGGWDAFRSLGAEALADLEARWGLAAGTLSTVFDGALTDMWGNVILSTDDWASRFEIMTATAGGAVGGLSAEWAAKMAQMGVDTTGMTDEAIADYHVMVQAAAADAELLRIQFEAANSDISASTDAATGEMKGKWHDFYADTAERMHDLERRLGLELGSIKTLTGRTLADMTRQWGNAGDDIVEDFQDVVRDVELTLKGIEVPEIVIPVSFEDPGEVPGAEFPEFQGGTRGRFLDFGAGTTVRLHGRERVVTEGEEVSREEAPAPASQPANVTINMTVHGSADRDFAERLVKLIGGGGSLYTRARGVLR